MPDLKLIDCHVHCFPTGEAARDFMGRVVRRPEADVCGTVEELHAAIGRSGVDHVNILMFTPTSIYVEDGMAAIPPDVRDRAAAEEAVRREAVCRVTGNNDWCAAFVKEHPNLSFFCGVDPVRMTEDEMLSGIDRWMAAGAKGVKIVPATLRIFGDDERLLPLYDYCCRQGVPLLTQSAGNPAPGQDLAYAQPATFGRVLPQFPDLRLIFAHMAYFPYLPDNGADELAELTSRYANVSADLSLRLGAVADGAEPAEWLVSTIRRLGADRVLFGTNFPLADQARSVEAFRRLPLTDEERELIAHKNFERITGA